MSLPSIGPEYSRLLPTSTDTNDASRLSGSSPSKAGSIPFGDVVSSFLSEANAQQMNVGTEVQRLVTGESDSVHDVVLSVAKADLSFRLVMEIRNQLISSYQEIMRMQV